MRFNVFKKAKREQNFEGAEAFSLDPRTALYSAVVTTSLSTKFYETDQTRIDRIRELIAKNDAEFVGKLAVYARTNMHMRSIPLVLAVELAKTKAGAIVGDVVKRIVQRADEITELLAYYQLANNRSGVKKLNRLSKQIQRGLANAFNNFDEYQFAKYDRAGEITLRDALFLVHPKAVNEEQQVLFDKLAKNELETPYTWETELSLLGQKKFTNELERQTAFRERWEQLITSGKVGYMALMRNLRNMIEAGISPAMMADVCRVLSDRNSVMKSKQLPFRFLAAYREVKELQSGLVPMVLDALEVAVEQSAQNIRGFDINTSVLIACDVSGSMQKSISQKSKIMNYDIGLLLGMLLQSRCGQVETGMFGDIWKVFSLSRKNILGNVQELYKREGEVGYATNGYLVLRDLINRRKQVDKIMMFTDCQLWNSNASFGSDSFSVLWKQYRQIAPEAKLYLFDLAGYGNTPIDIRTDGVYLIAGWSDKIFDVLSALEEGGQVLAEIEKTEL